MQRARKVTQAKGVKLRGGIVELEHLNVDFVRHLDKWAGVVIAANGGFGDLTGRMEAGEMVRYQFAPQFVSQSWQHEQE